MGLSLCVPVEYRHIQARTSARVSRDEGVSEEEWRELQQAQMQVSYEELIEEAVDEECVKELEEKKDTDAEYQRKIKEAGVCVQGFNWVRLRKGYRCAGGMHYMSLEELDKMD